MRWPILTVLLLGLALVIFTPLHPNHCSTMLDLGVGCKDEALSHFMIRAQGDTVLARVTNGIPELDLYAETQDTFAENLPLSRIPILLDSLAMAQDGASDDLTSELISRWASEDPHAAAAWAAQLSDPSSA